MDRVKGKVAIITGAAQGLGKAYAELLAKEGAKVVVTDILQDVGEKTVAEIIAAGGEAVFMKLDVSNESQWIEVVDKTMSRFGKLNVLVNNAGIIFFKKIKETPLEMWHKLMSINLDGCFLGTKHVVEAMKKGGGGSIVNIASVNGYIAEPLSSAYITSKGAIRLFTKAAAIEFSKVGYDYNIRVNAILPGRIKTERSEQINNEYPPDDEEKRGLPSVSGLRGYPIGRIGEPMDVAQGVLFLASDDASFITGQELIIDGGWTIH